LSYGDGDTILHSAAKSNDMKMMEFILQRISPSTKQRMLKMENKHNQLPYGAKRQDGTPFYPQTHFYKLPKDVLFIILQYSVPGDE
jgi:hypothetical protein